MVTRGLAVAQRTTDELERIDRMIAQAERFSSAGKPGEARARARQALVKIIRSIATPESLEHMREMRQRHRLAMSILRRHGGRARTPAHPVPESWY